MFNHFCHVSPHVAVGAVSCLLFALTYLTLSLFFFPFKHICLNVCQRSQRGRLWISWPGHCWGTTTAEFGLFTTGPVLQPFPSTSYYSLSWMWCVFGKSAQGTPDATQGLLDATQTAHLSIKIFFFFPGCKDAEYYTQYLVQTGELPLILLFCYYCETSTHLCLHLARVCCVCRSGLMSSWFGIRKSLMASLRSLCHLMPSGFLMLLSQNCKKKVYET